MAEEGFFQRAGYQPITWPVLTEYPPGAHLQAVTPAIDPLQFMLFQLSSDTKAPITDLHAITPELKGSDEKPDVQVRIELVSFQLAEDGVDPKMQATLRLDIGQDRASATDQDPLFWSIAAGLDLAAQAVAPDNDPKQRAADFGQAFRRRPVEIAGGLAELRIQLVAHEPPPWWRRIFSFAEKDSVRKLVSAVGFPGIALDAVKLLDEALSRFEDARSKPILQSRPMSLTLSERAVSEFTGGLSSVKAAVLNPGIFLLLRYGDADIIRNNPPIFLGGIGRLVPGDSWDGQKYKQPAQDPYEEISYVVLKVKSRESGTPAAL